MKTRALVVALPRPRARPASWPPRRSCRRNSRLWLEDAGPILTKTERAVFNRLQTNADRAKFVRFFWRMRDPYPDTAENEFQKEYEERIRFADKNFGHFSPKRGSQTDRGYFYVVLGKPLERTQYTTQSAGLAPRAVVLQGGRGVRAAGLFLPDLLPARRDRRLPPLFPDRRGPGEAGHPRSSGAGSRDPLDRPRRHQGCRSGAGQRLPELSAQRFCRRVSASFSSDSIIASVRGLPEKKFSDNYARSYMNYKDYIETDYTDNYLQSVFQVRVFRAGRPGLPPLGDRAGEDELRHPGRRDLRQLRVRPAARGRPRAG
ncbi:MAG: GWxTD domain-containing protein [Candidatus Moduliflexus flocculans]|nr:GWxTD domain-containing protein [Candidatus Moduliflexus flocculans]